MKLQATIPTSPLNDIGDTIRIEIVDDDGALQSTELFLAVAWHLHKNQLPYENLAQDGDTAYVSIRPEDDRLRDGAQYLCDAINFGCDDAQEMQIDRAELAASYGE